jgi:hypothetical protein
MDQNPDHLVQTILKEECMNKVTTAALAGLVAVTATANASMSRWNGFGDANAYIADVQDIWTLPGVVASNKNATYFEFAGAGSNVSGGVNSNTGNTGWGGVHGEVGPGVLGIWVNRGQNANIKGIYSGLNNPFVTQGNVTAGNLSSFLGITSGNTDADSLNTAAGAGGRVDLLYGFGLNDGVDLGISLSRANNNSKFEDGNSTGVGSYDAGAFGLGLGAEIKEVAIFKLLEVGLTIDMDSIVYSVKNTGGEDKVEHSANVYALRVGGDVAGDNGMFGRAELGFQTGGGSSKNGVTSAGTLAVGDKEYKVSGTNWNLGYAMGKSGDKGMGLLGLMLKGTGASSESDAANTKSDQGSLALQLTTAGEAKIKEWLTARAGIAANVYQSSSSSNPNGTDPTKSDKTTTSNNGAAVLSTGLSLNFGQVTIDGVLNQDVLQTGTFLVSGVPESLFGQISATWGW